MTDEELIAFIEDSITNVDARGPQDMGKLMGLLSKSGCNAGSCHGSFQGKNGFRLSLFGYEPGFDYAALTRDNLGRRVDVLLDEPIAAGRRAVSWDASRLPAGTYVARLTAGRGVAHRVLTILR